MGVILYQLLTGRTPFTGETALAVVLKHITEVPPAPSVHYAGVHKGLEAVTLKALAKDRNERFQSRARCATRSARRSRAGRCRSTSLPRRSRRRTAQIARHEPAVVHRRERRRSSSRGMTAPAAGHRVRAHRRGRHLRRATLTPLGTQPRRPSRRRSRARDGRRVSAWSSSWLARRWRARSAADERPQSRGVRRQAVELTASPQRTGRVRIAHADDRELARPHVSKATTVEVPPPPVADGSEGAQGAASPATGHGAGKTGVEPPPQSPSPSRRRPRLAAVPEPPAPPAALAPPPPPPPSRPPAAPAFNPRTAALRRAGSASNGATNAKDLAMSGTAAAWTTCAQQRHARASRARRSAAACISASRTTAASAARDARDSGAARAVHRVERRTRASPSSPGRRRHRRARVRRADHRHLRLSDLIATRSAARCSIAA